MCQHEYIGNYAVGTSLTCQWPSKFSEWSAKYKTENNTPPINGLLPVDSKGMCLFHSRDKAFKWGNGFEVWMKALLYYADSDANCDTIDCREFELVGSLYVNEQLDEHAKSVVDKHWGDIYIWSLKDAGFSKMLDLRFCKFHDKVTIDTCIFSKGADLTGASFETALDIDNCHFEGHLNLDRVNAEELALQNSNVADSFFGNRIKVSRSFTISGCTFANSFMMLHSVIDGEIATFEYNHFGGVTSFDDSIFNCMVSFSNSDFEKETSIHRVGFHDQVYFTKLSVADTLIIKGHSKTERCFDAQVEFSFESLTGTVKLENANYFHLDRTSRLLLDKLAEEKKVDIGPGCLTYANSIAFEVSMTSTFQYFSEEIARTFSFYFKLLNGIHLGVNVKRVSDEILQIVYFTDELIDDGEFRSRISIAQQELKKLLSSEKPPVNADDEPEHYAVLLDLWAKSKFNFVRAGLAVSAGGLHEAGDAIKELFKPLYSQAAGDPGFFVNRTLEETKKIFPQINLHIDMAKYDVKISNNAHSPIQIGSGNIQQINQSTTDDIRKVLDELKERLQAIDAVSEKHSEIIIDILRELNEQANSGKIYNSTYELLKDRLETLASVAEISNLLITLGQFAK